MVQKYNSARFGQGAIYTLAQNETVETNKQAVILYGIGSEYTVKGYGNKRGKRKMISQAMALALIDVAKEKGDEEMVKTLWHTYRCLDMVYTSDNRIYGNYCKNRFCTVCTAIRKADKINTYLPVLQKWNDAYFVTLTVKACTLINLKARLKACIRGIKRIIAKYRKQFQRGKGKKLMGIRSLECNYNPTKKTYNPHFHLIVPDKETAEILVNEWLTLWTPKYAGRIAQKYSKVWNLDTALIEVIKYGSKIFTEPDVNNKAKEKGNSMIYVKAFYNILAVMKGLRLFERFGFDLPKSIKKQNARVTTDFLKWKYLPEFKDWQHTESEQILLGYIPQAKIEELLENYMNHKNE